MERVITHEAAMAVLGCKISCGWARGINDCDFYGPEEKIEFTRRIADGQSHQCPSGVIQTSQWEAIDIINQ